MIPFPFNENRFSFFDADHLLVGQLCTNPKSDRSLLSCLKDQHANPDGSTLDGTAQRIGRPFGSGGAEGHHQEDPNQGVHRKGPGNHWWNHPHRPIQQIARDLGISNTTVNACVKEDFKCRSYRCQTSQILTEMTKNLRLIKSVRPPPPRPEPAGLLHLVIRQEHHQHDLPQHQSQPDPRHLPSIRRAPAGTCRKDMLPVPVPYWGGDWGLKRQYWIDVSSTT